MMKRPEAIILLMAAVLILHGAVALAEDGARVAGKLVYVFDLRTEISPAAWRTVQQSMNRAEEMQADYIVIHMNTYGGLVHAADSIRTRILNCPIPVYVFVDNNAISAGALIAIAADRIYMRDGASIGAATVVYQTGEAAPDKNQAVMRSMMRSTAQAHGRDTIVSGQDTVFRWRRDPKIAEAMVDPTVYVEGVVDSTKVLTLTMEEAIRLRYCDGRAESIEDIMRINGIAEYRLERYEPTLIERIIQLLISPYLQGLLIMIIIGGIYFELQTPGIGFPLAAAAVAALLYFAPLYLEGLASNWELLLFFAGLILIAVEVFALPGFGVAGISGIVLTVLGLSLAMVDNLVFEWDFTEGILSVFRSVATVTGSAALALVLSIWIGRSFFHNPRLKRIMLTAEQRSADGYVSFDDLRELTGMQGTARSMLRPSGKVDINGKVYDAVCEIGYIDAGEQVKVTRYETGQLYVVKKDQLHA